MTDMATDSVTPAGSKRRKRTSDRRVAEQETSVSGLRTPRGLFDKSLSNVQLEKVCYRMGRSLKAGIPFTKALSGESRFLSGPLKRAFDQVRSSVGDGSTAADALEKQNCFPSLLVEMVRVGEETGRIDEAFLRLADHYRNLVHMRRSFIQGITWPVLQLIAATGVITLMFLIMAWLQSRMAFFQAPDIFRLGLSPIGNLVLFWSVIAGGCVTSWLAIKAAVAGWFGRLPMRLALHIPLLGSTIRTLALSRFAWSFGMAIDSGMDAVRAIRLGVRSTQNHYYAAHEEALAESIADGDEFFVALDRTDAFSAELLQAVQIGEQTGELTESLERLSDDYREQSEFSLRRISQVSGILIFVLVASILGVAVMLMYANYLGTLHEALNNPMGTTEQIAEGEKSTNPVIAAKNEAVKDFMEKNEDFNKIKSMYEHLSDINRMTPDEFLDGFGTPDDSE